MPAVPHQQKISRSFVLASLTARVVSIKSYNVWWLDLTHRLYRMLHKVFNFWGYTTRLEGTTCASHVWWLLWSHGRTEPVESPGIEKLFPKWSGNTKRRIQLIRSAALDHHCRWQQLNYIWPQVWVTVAPTTHHPASQPASFIGLVGKERCRVPHYQNLESGSDTQGITSKQSKCGNWIILIFGRGEKDLKYISFVYLFMPFRSFSRWAWMTDNFEERGRYVR